MDDSDVVQFLALVVAVLVNRDGEVRITADEIASLEGQIGSLIPRRDPATGDMVITAVVETVPAGATLQ